VSPGPHAAEPVVRLRGAAVGYGDRAAIRGVDLDLARGEVLAVLGPNGAGKSTLVRGILGLAPLLAGSLELFGVPSSAFRDRYRIGYVPQRHTIHGALPATVREVVASGRLARRRWWARAGAADRAAVDEAVFTVGLSDRADEPVATLSGGQQRRALIARALAAEPDVLVMDEPTAGVDTANQQVLADTLGSLVDRGATLLVVTHEVGPLVPLVTRATVMRDGRVAYDGPLTAAMVGASDAALGGDHHHPHGSPLDDSGSFGLDAWTGRP
jgi:zinc transport system ATP-binding protein